VTPELSLAQAGSGQGGNRSVPKKEREIHGVDFRVVYWLLHDVRVDSKPAFREYDSSKILQRGFTRITSPGLLLVLEAVNDLECAQFCFLPVFSPLLAETCLDAKVRGCCCNVLPYYDHYRGCNDIPVQLTV